MGIVMRGWRDAGTVRPMRERHGAILTTIITGKAGSYMKATGITRIMAGSMVTS
jgi:hypothetical protein